MTEQDERSSRHFDHAVSLYEFALYGQVRTRRIECHFPPGMIELIRNPEGHRLMVRVQQQQEVLVLRAPTLAVANLRRHPVEKHAERAHPPADFPVVGLHALAIRPEPNDVLVRMNRLRVVVIERKAMKVRMLLAVPVHPFNELEEFLPPII